MGGRAAISAPPPYYIALGSGLVNAFESSDALFKLAAGSIDVISAGITDGGLNPTHAKALLKFFNLLQG